MQYPLLTVLKKWQESRDRVGLAKEFGHFQKTLTQTISLRDNKPWLAIPVCLGLSQKQILALSILAQLKPR